ARQHGKRRHRDTAPVDADTVEHGPDLRRYLLAADRAMPDRLARPPVGSDLQCRSAPDGKADPHRGRGISIWDRDGKIDAVELDHPVAFQDAGMRSEPSSQPVQPITANEFDSCSERCQNGLLAVIGSAWLETLRELFGDKGSRQPAVPPAGMLHKR